LNDFDYPLLLESIPVPRPWGGGRLDKLFKRPIKEKTAQPIGEWWDVSTFPTDPGNPDLVTVNRIENGPYKSIPLDQVTDIPVVIKILDANEKLSVQNHPVTKDVRKDEMWYVMYADPDAYLYCGLKDGVDVKEFCELVQSDSPDEEKVLSLLNKYDNLKPGMHFNVPSGTIHAVGPGVVAFEVSEKNQVTYRLYDYNRGRALHLEEGCIAATATRPPMPVLNHGLLVEEADNMITLTEFPTFTVAKAVGNRIGIGKAKNRHIITAINGDVKIEGLGPQWVFNLKHSYSCIIPANSQPYNIDTQGSKEVLITAVMDTPKPKIK
ncbi:MAG: class I mannose-6-phosphate isomerase, partial [Armatimonadota bacterium]